MSAAGVVLGLALAAALHAGDERAAVSGEADRSAHALAAAALVVLRDPAGVLRAGAACEPRESDQRAAKRVRSDETSNGVGGQHET